MIGYPCFKYDFEHFGGGSALVKKQPLLISVSMSPKYWLIATVLGTMESLHTDVSLVEQYFEQINHAPHAYAHMTL